MAIARTTKETFDYITLADRELPQEKQTRFHLRRLSTATMLMLRNLRDGEDARLGSWLTVALRAGIAGWENYVDPDGKAVPAVFDRVPATISGIQLQRSLSEESINHLSTGDAMEIALAVMTGNELTVEDVKN